MCDHVDGLVALLFNIMQRDASTRTYMAGIVPGAGGRASSGAVGMNGRQRSAMARIQSIEKDARFGSSNLTHNDPVRPVAKGSLEQVREPDLASYAYRFWASAEMTWGFLT